MSSIEHSPIVEARDESVVIASQAAHALELIDAQQSITQDRSAPVDPYARYRTHLTRIAFDHVEDAMGDYLSQRNQEELGFTPEQAAQIHDIARMIVREFAFDVVKGHISLEPSDNGQTSVRRVQQYVNADHQATAHQVVEPHTPPNIEEGRGYN